MASERIEQAVFAAVDAFNRDLLGDEPIPKDLDVILFGADGSLSSLQTVNFVVLLDERLGEMLESAPSIAEHLAEQEDAEIPPTLGGFVDLAESLLERYR